MDVVDLDRRAAATTTALIARTTPDQFDASTPCPEWRVRDLLAHLVAGNVKYTAIAEGADWARGVPAVDLAEDPGRQYRETVEVMLQAWRRPGVLDRELSLPRGRGPAAEALYVHLGETLVHGWDLAKATGQEPAFDEEVVVASLTNYRGWLPSTRSEGVPFQDEVSLAEDADPIDRLAAFLGRDVAAWSA